MAKPKPTVEIDTEFRKFLDRLGELKTWYQQNKPLLDEMKRLEGLARARCENSPANLPVRLEGNHYYVDLGPKENEREVTDPVKCFDALKKALGLDKLKAALKYTMKLIDASTTEEERKKFIRQERTGARDVTAVLKEAPRAA